MARLVFGALGLAFMAWSAVNSLDGLNAFPRLAARDYGGAVALIMGALALLLVSWASILGMSPFAPKLARGLYLSQLGKYIPGVFWQPVGQVAFASDAGVPMERAAAAYPFSVVTSLAAALTLGAAFPLVSGVELDWRLALLVGLLFLPLLRRSWIVSFLDRLSKRFKWVRGDLWMPQQVFINRAFGWMVVAFACQGVAFALLLDRSDSPLSILAVVAAFPVAWAIGFLAIPFPAGLGVREAVLIALIGGTTSSGAIVAASIAYRLLVVVAEALMVLLSGLTSLKAPNCGVFRDRS